MPFLNRMRLLLLCLLCSAHALSAAVIRETFESPESFKKWSNDGAGRGDLVETGTQSHELRVETSSQSTHLVQLKLPLEDVRGRQLAVSARFGGENIVRAVEPWHGVKVMLQIQTPRGPDYQAVMDLAGTFDWKTVSFSARVPSDAAEVSLVLGLGEATGTAWFDDVEITVTAAPRQRPSPQPTLLPPEKQDRRTTVPRLRGVMYGPKAKEEDVRKLAEWKGNLIRWQFYWYDGSFPDKRLDLARYDSWLEETIAEVDRMLPLCRELGISLVIDLHTPPGGTDTGQMAIFQRKEYQEKFIAAWDKLAAHFKNEPAVWAYDLLNEPAEGKVAEGLMDWHSLAAHAANRIRAIDDKHAIIVEPGPHGGWGNLAYFEPIKVPGIIYSVHMYDPLRFTHQGVLEGMPAGVMYPGDIEGKYWDKAALKQLLEPVRDYQKDYNVPIYVGEFSAPRWAPGDSAARYLRDCISIFEEYGWDWSYHAFREWQGWNVELGADPADQSPSREPTERMQVLQDGFGKN